MERARSELPRGRACGTLTAATGSAPCQGFSSWVGWETHNRLGCMVTHYWGMKVHREGVNFLLGLILGDHVCGSIWAPIGPAIGKRTYRFFT